MNERPGFRRPRILPPAWLALALSAMFALDRWLPLAALPLPARVPMALLFIAVGFGMLATAIVAFLRARTGLIPFSESTALVTSGFYRVTRNPMYLGMVLLLIGSAIWLGSLGAWLPVPPFVWIIRERFIRPEERFLRDIHGAPYDDYCRKVRRWI